MESFDVIGGESLEEIHDRALDPMEADASAERDSRGYPPHKASFIRAIDVLTQ